jgi:hypothetical protein
MLNIGIKNVWSVQKIRASVVKIVLDIQRKGRIKSRGKVICKGFCNNLWLCDNIVSDFNLDNRLVITFKFRNILPNVLCLVPEILVI